jgi:ABC-type polysaccharide/polyol phosphate export permease
MYFRNAIYLAWSETKARYKKSVLGPFWLVFGNLIGVLGLSVVWSSLLKENPQNFIPSLTIGMIIWQLIAGAITDGPTTFIRQAAIIRNVAIPAYFFVIRSLSRQIINLLHNLLIVIGVMIYFDFQVKTTFWLVLPGLILVLLNLYWLIYALGMMGARFRDLEYLVNAIMPLLFFISPVIFRPDHLPFDIKIIWLNPLSYFLEIVRAPLMGKIPAPSTYILLAGLAIGGFLLIFMVHKKYHRRLSFWV